MHRTQPALLNRHSHVGLKSLLLSGCSTLRKYTNCKLGMYSKVADFNSWKRCIDITMHHDDETRGKRAETSACARTKLAKYETISVSLKKYSSVR